MASISLQQLKIVEDQLHQIREAIANLDSWNESLTSADDFLTSPALRDAIDYFIGHIYEIVPVNI